MGRLEQLRATRRLTAAGFLLCQNEEPRKKEIARQIERIGGIMSRPFQRSVICVSSALLVSFLAAFPAFGQQASAIRIGVALPASSADAASDNEVRDRLVKLLNQHRNEKKLKAPLEAVALSAPPGGRALTEATKKTCEYVLYTRVKPAEISSQYQPAYSDAAIGTRAVVTAKVEYLMRRLSDNAIFASGTATSDEVVSDKDALTGAVDRVANAVLSDLKKGGSVARTQQQSGVLEAITPVTKPGAPTGVSFCQWLPGDIGHADALRGVCEYAMTLPEKMPNFVCRQETQRFEGRSSVPQDLITAAVRYEDGDESYSDLKLNGKPVAEGAARGAGLWSSGQFEGGLRAVFHSANAAEFDFFGEDEAQGRRSWVFTFEIEHQNEPLWQLRAKDEVIAPAYGGEIWVDEKSGEVVRFRSTAKDLPPTFPMQSAEIQTGYADVAFGDGTDFVLPVDSSVATRYQGMQPTTNVVRFSGCHRFGAKSRILTGAPKATTTDLTAEVNAEDLARELQENKTIYSIFLEQAVREDEARLAAEQRLDLNVAAIAGFRNIAALERQRQAVLAKEAMAASSAPVASASNSGQDASKRSLDTASGTRGDLPTFRVSVNLVPVSVVTRDGGGHAVGTLAKENFRLFDERKPQVISRFSVERRENLADKQARGQNTDQAADMESSNGARENRPAQNAPNHVALLFDDLHAVAADLTNVREAATRRLGALQPHDSVALFTTFGDVTLDFTTDREKLRAALQALTAHATPGWNCPAMDYFEADQIVNHGNSDASSVAIQDALSCGYSGTAQMKGTSAMAEKLAMSRALEVAVSGRVSSDRALGVLHDVIVRTAAITGRRTIVLISPGFLTATPDAEEKAMAIIDIAVKAGIVINAFDLSGVPGTGVDLTNPGDSLAHLDLDRQDANARNELMADLAYGTGGTFFHNNNDLNEGFRQTSEIPEYVYVLGFSPQKLDGKFHRLKVSLSGREKLTVQARPGYYAIKPETTQ